MESFFKKSKLYIFFSFFNFIHYAEKLYYGFLSSKVHPYKSMDITWVMMNTTTYIQDTSN